MRTAALLYFAIFHFFPFSLICFVGIIIINIILLTCGGRKADLLFLFFFVSCESYSL